MNCLRYSRSAFSPLQIVRRYCNPTPAPPSGSGTKQAAGLFFAGAALFFFGTCRREKVPYTNRVHWVFLPPSLQPKFGDIFFDKIKEKRERRGDALLGPSDPDTVRVRRIASDIIRGVHDVFPTNSQDDDGKQVRPQTRHLNWEVIVVDSVKVRAYSFPNGKIVVHTGLLHRLKTDAEIAALIAHQAAHIVAKHYMEVSRIIPLTFQRNEMEADLIGLKLLAAAGFDTHVAHGHGVYKIFGEIGGNLRGFHPWCKKE